MARSKTKRNRDEKEHSKGGVCCSRKSCLIIVLLLLFAIAGSAFAVWWFFFKDVWNPFAPEVRGLPTSAPTSSPRTFAPTVTASPTSSNDMLDSFCPNDNTLDSRRFINTRRNTFYVIEIVAFGSALAKKRYDQYKVFMKDNIIRQANGEVIFEFIKEGGRNFESVFIVSYPNGNSFRKNVMEEIAMVPILNARKSLLSEDLVYFTTLNEDVPKNFPDLASGPQFYSTPAFVEKNPEYYNPVAFFVHTMKFQSTPMNGREKVALFDAETEELKSQNGVFAHGWFDIIITCRGKKDQFDQIRIESVKTFEEMGEAMSTDKWVEAQRSREEGLAPVSFSNYAYYTDFSNLYHPDDDSPVWSPAWSPAMSPAATE